MSAGEGADVRELTEDYERWLRETVDVVEHGLVEKHRVMSESELGFLRGSYYLWLVRVAEHVPDVLRRARVPVAGDLHVQNFGTWRDLDQVRRWGINDLDELSHGPWLLDVLRLATSAVLSPHLHLDHPEIAEELLAAYANAVPGVAVEIDGGEARHLTSLVPVFGDPQRFYARLARGRPTEVPPSVARAAAGVAEAGWRPSWHEHDAGTGSLGLCRAVGVGPARDGNTHAREVKQLGRGTAVWAASRLDRQPTPDPDLYGEVAHAVRGPAGARRVGDWQVRDLAPDVVRIELAGLRRHDARRLLRSMARATADVHGVDSAGGRAAQAEAAAMSPDELAGLVATMVGVTRADLATWREAPSPTRP